MQNARRERQQQQHRTRGNGSSARRGVAADHLLERHDPRRRPLAAFKVVVAAELAPGEARGVNLHLREKWIGFFSDGFGWFTWENLTP